MRWFWFFVAGWGLPLCVYVALQSGALVCLRGRWRVAVSSAVPFMLFVCGYMTWTYVQGNRMWPFIIALAAPGASLAIVVIWAIEVMTLRRLRSLVVLVCICAAALSAGALSRRGLRALWGGRWTVVTAVTLLSFAAVLSQVSGRPRGAVGSGREAA